MLDTKMEEALQDVSFKIDVRDIQGIPSHMGRKVVRFIHYVNKKVIHLVS